MGKENQLETTNCGVDDHDCPPVKNDELVADTRYSTDSDSGFPTCRVCHSAESDRRGDAALGFLGIIPPIPEPRKSNVEETADDVIKATETEKNSVDKSNEMESGFIEITSPDGEVFICTNDIEMGIQQHQDALLELGCSCKNELALVHYACALKWFLNHGSTLCEICAHLAENIKTAQLSKVFKKQNIFIIVHSLMSKKLQKHGRNTLTLFSRTVKITFTDGASSEMELCVEQMRCYFGMIGRYRDEMHWRKSKLKMLLKLEIVFWFYHSSQSRPPDINHN